MLTIGIHCHMITIMDIIYDWDNKKNEKFISSRGVSFEEVIAILEDGDVLDIIDHPNQTKFFLKLLFRIEKLKKNILVNDKEAET